MTRVLQDSAEAMRDANALLAAMTRKITAARADVAQRQAQLDSAAAALAEIHLKHDTRHDQVYNTGGGATTCQPALQ